MLHSPAQKQELDQPDRKIEARDFGQWHCKVEHHMVQYGLVG